MGLAERRKMLGYSQEGLAHTLGVDRTTVGRWETGRTVPQPGLRPRLAKLLQVGLSELNTLVSQLTVHAEGTDRQPSGSDHHGSGDTDDMIRREFLRVITVTGTLTSLTPTDAQALAEATQRGASEDFTRMNSHLWQVYQLARSKSSVQPVVHDQLLTLTRALEGRSDAEAGALCRAAGDLFQLAGELAFDNSRYTDAAASYTLAASASREARSYDLWACALVRHAYIGMSGKQYKEAAGVLSAAEKIAKRGDGALSTRYWVASVQAEAYAGMGQLTACERALDEAQKVVDHSSTTATGGWLRFDGSRLMEERGARYLELGRLDLAETALTDALKQRALANGQSFRRRGAVLTDLAVIGAKRYDPDQVVTFGREALELARASSSGYVARRLRGLRAELGPLNRDARVADLGVEIDALTTWQQT
ncbi:helix-turn-helix transcriptional regulator [Streptomyces niveus]|uniref:helix-turn-helix transcriptional regulator n=2 Tax=Streptomyces TaxID=1883 RepID=UPI001072824C|nr:helix-turn-helix transcriptional regulator [Streptomyces sp. 4R-3d]TFI24031.1 XRE family transcriptional regulator [Streptomyces sp. 4R-3d]